MSEVDFKLVLLGSVSTGKTSLIRRLTVGEFTENYQATIGLAYRTKVVEYDGRMFNIAVWDTAGSERFDSMTRSYYRNAAFAIICYDIFFQNSWKRAQKWVRELQLREPECKRVLCGTKLDLLNPEKPNRGVELNEISRFAKENNCETIEISNKTGYNIDKLFELILEDYSRNHPPALHIPRSSRKFNLSSVCNSQPQHPQRCCALL